MHNVDDDMSTYWSLPMMTVGGEGGSTELTQFLVSETSSHNCILHLHYNVTTGSSAPTVHSHLDTAQLWITRDSWAMIERVQVGDNNCEMCTPN
jgi:hypothetical protein